MDKKQFGKRLKQVREWRDLSQRKLATELDVPESGISHWESGRRLPDCSNLSGLARTLRVTTDYLLGLVSYPSGAIGYPEELELDVQYLTHEQFRCVSRMVRFLREDTEGNKEDEDESRSA